MYILVPKWYILIHSERIQPQLTAFVPFLLLFWKCTHPQVYNKVTISMKKNSSYKIVTQIVPQSHCCHNSNTFLCRRTNVSDKQKKSCIFLILSSSFTVPGKSLTCFEARTLHPIWSNKEKENQRKLCLKKLICCYYWIKGVFHSIFVLHTLAILQAAPYYQYVLCLGLRVSRVPLNAYSCNLFSDAQLERRENRDVWRWKCNVSCQVII